LRSRSITVAKVETINMDSAPNSGIDGVGESELEGDCEGVEVMLDVSVGAGAVLGGLNDVGVGIGDEVGVGVIVSVGIGVGVIVG
jgi:hypothetical protein